ncbi:MAG: AcrB/AcrD/AcrF family protein, partial [Verrucomicrobiaceae bacterium]|nr:AcrB/AcrD/AcrF family protein [Verrucomicrobiaceae bacterium]
MSATRPPRHVLPASGGVAQYFVEHRSVGWLAMLAVLLWGWISYHQLPQQEDPSFPTHDAFIVTVFPGASALQVEQLVTRPLEHKIAEQEAVDEIHSQSRANVCVTWVLLRQGTKAEVAQEWEKLRARLGELTLPDGCERPRLDADYQATATLLFSITSPTHSYRELEKAAESLDENLKQAASVGRVRKFGNVPERVELRFPAETMAHPKFSAEEVIKALTARNSIVPGGTYSEAGKDLNVHLSGEFKDENELGEAILGVRPEGDPVRVLDVFDVRRGAEEPAAYTVDTLHRGRDGTMMNTRSVLLAVEMKQGRVIGAFDADVAGIVAKFAHHLPEGIEVLKVSDQPKATAKRIGQFVDCFIEAVLIVVFVALLLMDARTALVVAMAIPLTISMTLGGMALLHIPLQQISIASLIIALGMLVDDPVVAADGINRELADKRPRRVAAWLGPYRLRRAILFGTIINVVAFLPLALLPGDMGAFIIALPVVITLALVSSRIVSMTFIPLLGYHLLRGQKGFEAGGEVRSFSLFKPVDLSLKYVLPRYKRLLQAALRHPAWTLFIAYGLLAASCALTPFFGHQFFPPAERNQCLIDIQLPQASAVTETRKVCGIVAALLQKEAVIESAAVFCGGTAPNFYYNVLPREPAANIAQIVINTYHTEDVPALIVRLRGALDEGITGALCVVKQLDQGPVLEAPILIRLTGDDLDVLRAKADEISTVLLDAGGYKVNDDLGSKVAALRIEIDQEKANLMGISTLQTGRVIGTALTGFKVTELREQGHLVPVVMRLRPEDCNDIDKIKALTVKSAKGEAVPLASFAEVTRKPEYAAIPHFGERREVTVKAFAPFGELPSRILGRARKVIDRISLPDGCTLEYAGEARELRNSQMEMEKVMKISLALIALAMVIQFRSVVKSLVVMLTVPLGLAGAFVGLSVTHASFGFMALLGLVSLAGVIVSHIIVLSDFIEEAREHGMPLHDALVQAGLVRLRAVLATVLATVCGLIPLALKGGELWRPLTSVHIFGLLFATLLTLVVLPVW